MAVDEMIDDSTLANANFTTEMKALPVCVLHTAIAVLLSIVSHTNAKERGALLRGYGRKDLLHGPTEQPGLQAPLLKDSSNNNGRRLVYNREVLPQLPETDSIELYHLRSFHKQLIKVPTSSTSFGMQTSGIALRSTTTDEVLVFEYKPFSYEASFLPIVKMNETTSKAEDTRRVEDDHLYWDKRVVLEYTSYLDTSHWQHSTFLGHINGIVYTHYVDWIEEYLSEKERVFVPQSICSSPSSSVDYEDLSCFALADTWESFIAQSLAVFSSLSVELHAMLPPRAREIQILSNIEPLHVTVMPRGEIDRRKREKRKNKDNAKNGGEERREDRETMTEDGYSLYADATDSAYGQTDEDPGDTGAGGGNGSGRDEESDIDQSQSVEMATNSSSSAPSNPHIIAGGDATNAGEESEEHMEKWREDENVVDMSKQEMAEYYRELIGCMNAYTLEDFTSALRSCMKGNFAYVHINGNRYYKIKPRQPFAINKEYLMDIPQAQLMQKSAVSTMDIIIGSFLIVSITAGLLWAAIKLKLFEACFLQPPKKGSQKKGSTGSNSRVSSSFRFSTHGNGFFSNITRASSSHEGGYQAGRSELVALHSVPEYQMVPLGECDPNARISSGANVAGSDSSTIGNVVAKTGYVDDCDGDVTDSTDTKISEGEKCGNKFISPLHDRNNAFDSPAGRSALAATPPSGTSPLQTRLNITRSEPTVINSPPVSSYDDGAAFSFGVSSAGGNEV